MNEHSGVHFSNKNLRVRIPVILREGVRIKTVALVKAWTLFLLTKVISKSKLPISRKQDGVIICCIKISEDPIIHY